jgi:hypothetical protein
MVCCRLHSATIVEVKLSEYPIFAENYSNNSILVSEATLSYRKQDVGVFRKTQVFILPREQYLYEAD